MLCVRGEWGEAQASDGRDVPWLPRDRSAQQKGLRCYAGFLYRDYEDRFYFFECVELLRKPVAMRTQALR